jgi:hypothetical protein
LRKENGSEADVVGEMLVDGDTLVEGADVGLAVSIVCSQI